MNEELQIVVPLGARGVKIEGVGFVDNTCKTFSEAYERALGVVESTVAKPEFHIPVQMKQTATQGR